MDKGGYMDTTQKNEKITINLGIMELAEIDLLVDNLRYSNRSDFIRLAIRDSLEKHKDELEKLYTQSKDNTFEPSSSVFGGIGIIRLTKSALLRAKENNTQINIMVLGLLLIEKDIFPDLLSETIESIKVYGRVQASNSLTKVLEAKKIH